MVFLHAGNKHDGQEKKSLEQNWSRTFLFCFVFFHQGVGKSPNYCLAFCLALLYHTLLTKPLITSLELHQLLSGPLANLWGTWWRGVCVWERSCVYVCGVPCWCLSMFVHYTVKVCVFICVFVCLSVYLLTVILEAWVLGKHSWVILGRFYCQPVMSLTLSRRQWGGSQGLWLRVMWRLGSACTYILKRSWFTQPMSLVEVSAKRPFKKNERKKTTTHEEDDATLPSQKDSGVRNLLRRPKRQGHYKRWAWSKCN